LIVITYLKRARAPLEKFLTLERLMSTDQIF